MRMQGERGREKEGGRERGRKGEGHYREIKKCTQINFCHIWFYLWCCVFIRVLYWPVCVLRQGLVAFKTSMLLKMILISDPPEC